MKRFLVCASARFARYERLALLAATLLGAASLAAGCSAGEEDADASDSEINAGADSVEACKIFIVKDQKFVDLKTFASDPKRANDPIVQKILKPVLEGKQACPTDYTEIQKAESLAKCELQTRIVSERSALLKTPDVGRALASRACETKPGGPNDPNIFFLIDPIHAGKDLIPKDVELLGNNTVDGVFSYYAREPLKGPRDSFSDEPSEKARDKEPGIWKFYGTSEDFISNGYDCDVNKFHGGCISKFAQDNGVKGNVSGVRCASCHPGGGMVQKELNSPWSNWMQDPGGYTQKHKDVYGSFQDGDSFEGTTIRLNKNWSKKRVEVLAKVSVKEMLRPLFCTMDINLQSGGSSIRADLMIDLLFAGKDQFLNGADAFGGIGSTQIASMVAANYAAALKDLGQEVKQDGDNDKLVSFSPKILDTPTPFMYPERSQLDHQYIAALKASNKVTEDLIRDILFVDFTRPVYSPTRCSLADLADGITDPAKAKDELIKKLTAKAGAANEAEKEFLASLTSTGAAPRHQAEVDKYLGVCKARGTSDNAGLTKDAVTYASHLRQVAKLRKVELKAEQTELGILDFTETVPFTNLSDKAVVDIKFDPATCAIAK